jgi:uncharacterized integral membrane protein (TIGR00698 family)
MMEKRIKEVLPGLVLAGLVGVVAVELAAIHVFLDSLVIALLIGIILNFLFGDNPSLKPGVALAIRVFIPLGIIFYSLKLNFLEVRQVSNAVLFQLMVIIIVAFIATGYTGRLMGVNKEIYLLVGSGTAICGASAIAIISPVVNAKPRDTSVALAVVTVSALVALLTMETLTKLLSLNDTGLAVMAGSTLHMTGVVKTVVAGLDTRFQDLALSLKFTRVAALIVVVPLISTLVKRKFYVHWFIVVFALFSIFFTFNPGAKGAVKQYLPFYKYFFPTALGSIGLSTNLEHVMESGFSPLLTGLVGFVCVLLVFIAGTFIIPY